MVIPERSPSPPKEVTDSNRIGAEEDIDDFKVTSNSSSYKPHIVPQFSLSLLFSSPSLSFGPLLSLSLLLSASSLKGKTEEEVREIMSQREAHANAQILEMVGDIPDADAKPPENVLFVCKLNPATTAEDLEIIFSRFGPIISSEVIKDQKTGDSLQYAFIEFENEDDCISAYFKMDNVLIDDRRIHVDFCQSLAKVKGVRCRRLSSEKEEKLSDRFVAKSQTRQDGYEMVFDPVGEEGARGKKSRWDEEGGRRKGKEDKHRREKDERGERERRRDDRGRSDRKEKKERRHHRSRSRSGEREKQHKHRSRHRSRDRH